jgi:enamine deaminase RidA (YjgF/YER057c/UK114 family)
MNHYVIRDANDSPQSTTAETLDSALAQIGLDADDVVKAEVMVKGAFPPDNWQDVTPPKRKKLTTEDKLRDEIAELKRKIEKLEGKTC